MKSIIEVDIEELASYENNPRINDAAIGVVMKSIQEFGFQVPIIIDVNKVIIAGHSRFEAAKRLGYTKIPAIIAEDLSEAQAKAFRIMDNRASEQSKWDYIKLASEFDALETIGFDLDFSGFDLLDVEKIKMEFLTTAASSSETQSSVGESVTSSTTSDTASANGAEDDDLPEEPKNSAVIQYCIIFNNEEEQAIWHEYIKMLRSKYPELTTISERLIADINSHTA